MVFMRFLLQTDRPYRDYTVVFFMSPWIFQKLKCYRIWNLDCFSIQNPKSKNLNSKTAMIEDKELRELFKAECAEHLQRLSDGLLRLEKNPTDLATLEEVFREAHSLKGAARMVGVADIEILAHRFEDILGMARRGETALASNTIDHLYQGLDAMESS